MTIKIQVKRGLKTNLPILDSGELGWVTDNHELYIGTNGTNYQIAMMNDNVNFKSIIAEGNITLGSQVTDTITFTAKSVSNLNMNFNKINNLANGTAAGDAVNYSQLSSAATNDHVHGNITNDGKIGSTSSLVIVTGTSGILQALSAGISGQFLQYDGTWAIPPGSATAADDILDGSNIGTEITYTPYSTNQAANRKFYITSDNPTGTDRLNIGASFYATQLYDDGIRVHNLNSIINGGSFT